MKKTLPLVSAIRAIPQLCPLHNHIESFAEDWAKQGYSDYTIDQKVRLLTNLDGWLLRRQIKIEDFAEEHIETFLRYRRSHGHSRGGDRSTLRSVLGTLRATKITVTSLPTAICDANVIDNLQTRFRQYLIDERGLNAATITWYVSETRTFLLKCFGKRPASMAEISSRDVTQYVLHRARLTSPRTAQRTVTALRGFLRFLHQRGEIETNLASSVPRVANWTAAGLPKYLPAADVERLLDGCNGKTNEARRNRAILLLLARLGLRAGEVVHLTLDDIDWDAGELLICGKGGRHDRLPMPIDVGRALAAYIRYARPSCQSRRVFIRLNAPHQGLSGASNISFVVRQALKRVDLRPVFRGSHLLRHSLATRMLRAGASLTEIGKILRHELPSTTAIYAKVDLAALRALAQPWPGGEA